MELNVKGLEKWNMRLCAHTLHYLAFDKLEHVFYHLIAA